MRGGDPRDSNRTRPAGQRRASQAASLFGASLVVRFGRAKGPPRPPAGARTSGTIARIAVGQGYGFVRLRDRREVFFHRADLDESTPFNSLQIGDAVTFELIVDDISGPRAVSVTRRSRKKHQREGA